MTPHEIEVIRKIFREEIKALLPHLQSPPPETPQDPGAYLIALAKVDRAASITEAKRLSQEDSLRRREEKKRLKAA